MLFIPVEGVNIKTKPWPGRKFLTCAMEKMKEVEKGRRVEELVDVVGIFEGYKARPMEKEVSSVTARMEDWMVALPKSWRLVELKLVLKMNSVAEVELRITSVMVSTRGRVGEDISKRARERDSISKMKQERERERERERRGSGHDGEDFVKGSVL